MPLVGLLHRLQDRLVDAEADGGAEGGQGQVGAHADHAELGEGEEQQEHAAEHRPRLLDVPPVEQVNRWGREREKEGGEGWRPGLATTHHTITSAAAAPVQSVRTRAPIMFLTGLGRSAPLNAHLGQISGSRSAPDVLGDGAGGHVTPS